MGFLKCPRSSWASKLDAHPLVFFCWAFIDLVHPLHGNPSSSCWHQLMGISIARWLASSMWDFLIFCLIHTTSIIIFMTYITFVILSLHDHVVDIVFVAKPPCIIFHTCHSWFIAPSRYTAGGIHIESYLVVLSSCNSYVVINESVMIIIIRALPKKKKKEKEEKEKIK